MHDIDVVELRVAMLRAGKAQWEVAAALGMDPSTLSNMLGGRREAPPSLRLKLEKFFGLEQGTLKRKERKGGQ